MRRARRALKVVLGATLLALLVPTLNVASAQAVSASPWWHITSGSRPTYLSSAGGGEPGANEVQQLTVSATEGHYILKCGPCAEAGREETAFLFFEASHEEVQTALEAMYGTGNVTVSGGPGNAAGEPPYRIEFVGAFAETPVTSLEVLFLFGIEGGREEVKLIELTPGHPAAPDGEIVAYLANLGDAPANGASSPILISDVLPAGLTATGIAAAKPLEGTISLNQSEPIHCELATLSCELKKPLAPFDQIELRISVEVEPAAHSGELNHLSVSGGGATAASLTRPITVSGDPVPFGLEGYELANEEEGGAASTQAGSHPFQQTTTISLNQLADTAPLENSAHRGEAVPAALAKDLKFDWPAGLLGNPNPFPTCSADQFTSVPAGLEDVSACPAATAIGVAMVTLDGPGLGGVGTFTEPLFNLEPAFGEPARFGFWVPQANAPAFIDPEVRSGNGEDYGLTVASSNITQISGFLSATVTVFGVPGDSRHRNSRGGGCLGATRSIPLQGPCELPVEAHPLAFLSAPTACSGPMQSTVFGDSWLAPLDPAAFPLLASSTMPALDGCNQLQFNPQIESEPSAENATSPTGLSFDVNINDEGIEGASSHVQSQLKRAVVTLPQGFTTNPSVAEGLVACSQAAYEAEAIGSEPGENCPNESNVGEVEIESPLLPTSQIVRGSLFVAKQGENPNGDAQHPHGNLLTIYMVARNREAGVLVKQALRVIPDPVTGQLTTEVDNAPQLPFSHFHLKFRTGQRAPLITPPACGTYTVNADLYPWSNPGSPVHRESSFQITGGPEGLPCPSGGVPPFHPGLEAGTTNNAAGTYSPFYTHITRKDSEQEITRFSIKLPPGVIGKLAGVSECSDAGIAAAKAREKEGGGALEEANPSCPKNSEIGHSLVGSGVGNVLAYAPGKLYLAGPYHGSPISIVSITAAKVGPFDLGTVVVRFALNIDHETAEVSVDGAGSDPIPHIVDGIPVHLRDIRAYVDRPNFTLNPTSCAKKSTASTILGSGLDFVSPADDNPVTVSSPFQAADCASLGFKPALKLSLGGKKTHRGALPAFKAVLTYPKKGAYANIARAQVTLPPSEILEQAHLEKVCPKSVFTTGSTPGENCPASSIYGTARAYTPLLDEPLEGPVFLRTGYGTVLPELTATLNNKQIHIVLAGKIDSVQKKGTEISRIRNTFELVPDAPVSKFVLEMKGGSKGLLVNKTNICKGTHKAIAAFTAQNGKLHEFEPVLKASACAKKSKKSKK